MFKEILALIGSILGSWAGYKIDQKIREEWNDIDNNRLDSYYKNDEAYQSKNYGSKDN